MAVEEGGGGERQMLRGLGETGKSGGRTTEVVLTVEVAVVVVGGRDGGDGKRIARTRRKDGGMGDGLGPSRMCKSEAIQAGARTR